MAENQQWIQEMADVVDAAQQKALQQQQQEQRAQQEEVPTEPATSPRSIDPPVQEWSVAGVHQEPPPQQAQRPDYQQPVGNWREAIPYVVNYGHQSEEAYQRDADAARCAHLEDQWGKQRREEAEREWKEHEAASNVGKLKRVKQAIPTQSQTRPRALPQVHGELRASDPQAAKTQPTVAKKPPPSSSPAGFIRGDAPPMICTVQPPPPAGLPGPTPMTPIHPPRPPIAVLPKPQEAPAPPTSKHSLPQPAQEDLRPSRSTRSHFQGTKKEVLVWHLERLTLRKWVFRTQKALQRRWFLHLSNHNMHLQHKPQDLHHLAQLQLNLFQQSIQHKQLL